MAVKIYPPILALLLILNSALKGQASSSIHQLEWEYYQRHYSEPLPRPVPEPILPKLTRPQAPSKEIFGYHPYWMGTAWENYQYSLLTTIAYFSAEATAMGSLSDLHGWPVSGLINAAHSHGVAVVLTVTLFDPDELATLLSNPTYRQNLIDNLVEQVKKGNADGVNVDFERLPAEQKEPMVQFISDLTQTFHDSIPASQVTLAMPAVDWSGAWDYKSLAATADGLFIMGYDYHWSGGSSAGPVAPLSGWGTYNLSWTINDYLVKTDYQAGKLILGCPYYGYEWPVTSSSPGATTTGGGGAKRYTEMEARAQSYGKQRDAASQSPWYRYQNPGWFQGWYEDSLSLSLKYDLALQQDLKGIGMWALGYDGSNNELWDALANQFGAAASPTAPASLVIQNAGDGAVIIDFQGAPTADRYLLLRGYLSSTRVDTVGTFTQRPIILTDLELNQTYFLRLVAGNDFGYSERTEMLGVVPSREAVPVLIVNGFDRISGTTNSFDFIRQHGSALSAAGLTFDATSNEALVNGQLELNNYTIVDWILGEEGTATSSFSGTEQALVKSFLQQGGHLLVSGSEVGYDLVASGSGDDQSFYQDYLKAEYISDAAGGQQGVYSVYGTDASILEDLTDISYDDGSRGTYDVDWPDGIKPAGGAQLCARYSGVDYQSRGGAGIYYQGPFGTSFIPGALVYLAVGFEAIYPETKRSQVMGRIVNFFSEPTTSVQDRSQPLPRQVEITAIYPNPSNRAVRIEFQLPRQRGETAELTLIDLLGRVVVEKRFSTPVGRMSWNWDGRLASGSPAPSGVYFAILTMDGQTARRKFSLVK